MDRHVLSILTQNHAGVLSRVVGLFSRRGYNIDSLSVDVTEYSDVSRMTVTVKCENDAIEQIIKQVEKLVDVISIVELDPNNSIFRELVLVKVKTNSQTRSEVISIANIFRAKIIDVASEAMIIELTGDASKVQALTTLMEPFGILEIVRTGLTALCRGNEPIQRVK